MKDIYPSFDVCNLTTSNFQTVSKCKFSSKIEMEGCLLEKLQGLRKTGGGDYGVKVEFQEFPIYTEHLRQNYSGFD